jgi:assimilatory nitrate reductase catalytic subunit
VVSDITAQTDTARLANVILPATAWAEKDGTVTNSDRTISRQRSVLPTPGQARPDWDILSEVGQRMGFAAHFDYASPAEIFREYAALSAFGSLFGRDFDISLLATVSDAEYAALRPQRWPLTKARKGGRFFADGTFFHADGKARFLPVTWKPPAAKTEPRFPFRLNTGRLRDQWHTMTRTALSPRLAAHLPEPFADIHPEDAARLSILPADLVRLTSPVGAAILRARITDAVQPGQVFASMHWTGETAPSARIDALVPAVTDPISGQPESKAGVVAIQRFEAAWYGFAVARGDVSPDCAYWAKARTQTGYRVELAGVNEISDWEVEARRLFAAPEALATTITDAKRGVARVVLHEDGLVLAALFVAREPVAVMRDYLTTVPGTAGENVLTGASPVDMPDPGPVLCSCFGIGINTIVEAIETGQVMTVDAVGAALGAGTNCGSCRPEIAALLDSVRPREAAE